MSKTSTCGRSGSRELFARALRDNPDLHLVAVVPRYPDVDGRLALPPNMIGRRQAMETCFEASPQRVHVFDVENHEGTPVYVHAKVCVVDDVWACVGSDNFNRRSWTHDSELSCAVLDDRRRVRARPEAAADARTLGPCGRRQRGRRPGRPGTAVGEIVAAAEALDAWHASGREGPRPPGRLRPHKAEKLGLLTRLWAGPAYRMIYDPDGRSYRDRLTREVVNSTGRLAGPVMPVIGFHGTGPVRRMFGMRRAIVVKASASSILARCAPRQ